MRLAREQVRHGCIPFRFGTYAALAEALDALDLAPCNLEQALGLFQVRLRDLDIRLCLRHGLPELGVVESRDHLVPGDVVAEIGCQLLDAPADLGGDDKGSAGFQRARKSAA